MGSGKQIPKLREDDNALLRLGPQKFTRVLCAFTLSLTLLQVGAQAQQADNKKPGLDPVAASSPASKSAMGESPTRSSAQSLPKADAAKSGTGKAAEGKGTSTAAANTSDAAPDKAEKPEKSTLPFPVVSGDNLSSVSSVQSVNSHTFPSAIDIHGSAAGVLLHALKDTRYDLLSPLSIWLEEGPLLVSVRRPSEMVLVATKFGDVCVAAGGDALVVRGEEDTLRIVNLCTNGDTVFLNMHDKLWTASPWGHAGKIQSMNNKKGKKRTYVDIESGAVTIAPGYELVIGAHALTMDDAKPPDSVGRREFKTFEGGRFVVSEICIEHLTQLHDLIKNLNSHGEKAGGVFNEIMKNAGQLKSKQGDSGFEKNVPPPPKPPEPKRKPPAKVAPPPAKSTTPAPTTAPPAPASSNNKKPQSNTSPATIPLKP